MTLSDSDSAKTNPIGTAVHEVYWSDAFPWWILFRAASWAFTPTVVLLAAGGLLATWAGWSLADRLALPGGPSSVAMVSLDDGLVIPANPPSVPPPSASALPHVRGLLERLPAPLLEVARLLATPFSPTAGLVDAAGALARIGWFVVVWSIFGTAITRHVTLRLLGEESRGFFGGLGYGALKWPASFNAVVFVLLGIVVLSVPAALLGLAMRSEWGLAVVAVIWPIVLAGSIVLAILAVGLVVGWPLMVAAVGVERGDSFQAISTAFSYVYQRPLHYLFYTLVAAAALVPALAAAGLFADGTASLAMWAASWGMGHGRTSEVLSGLETLSKLEVTDAAVSSASFGLRALDFWRRCLATLLGAFAWGYFWAAATAIYLLLRRDVDGTEMDEAVIEPLPGDSA